MRREEFKPKHKKNFEGLGVRTLKFDGERNLVFESNRGKALVVEYSIIIGEKQISKINGTFHTTVELSNCENWIIQINKKHQIMLDVAGEKHVICKDDHIEENERILVYYLIPDGAEMYLCDGYVVRSVSHFLTTPENANSLIVLGRVLTEFYKKMILDAGGTMLQCENRALGTAETEKLERLKAEYDKNQHIRAQRDIVLNDETQEV